MLTAVSTRDSAIHSRPLFFPTLVLVRPMPEGTTQAVATAGAGNADRLIAMGAGGFCIVAAAGIALTEVKRRRKNRQQQRRDQIDEFFARDDHPYYPEDPQDATGEPWMEELADPAHEPLDRLCDRLFNSDDCDWRTPVREDEAPAEQPLCPVSDRGADEPLWPDADKSWWPVSDRATDPTAGLPQLAHESVAVLDKPVDERKTETRECVMSAKPRAKAKSKARKQRGSFGLRWLAIAAMTLFGALLLSWGLSPAHSLQTESRLSSLTVAPPQPKYETRAIRDIRTGHRVMAANPELAGQIVDEVDIDPATWRNVVLQMTKVDGGLLDIILLRPLDWINAYDAQAGDSIQLDLEEFGAVGPARVLSIGSCPAIEDGPGRVVTGTFAHSSADILDVHVEGVTEPIGTTANHPWWSEDRQKFVPAASLKLGERLRSADGEFRKVTSTVSKGGFKPVYNIEVDGEHVYFVSRIGLLVHNSCPLAGNPVRLTVRKATGLARSLYDRLTASRTRYHHLAVARVSYLRNGQKVTRDLVWRNIPNDVQHSEFRIYRHIQLLSQKYDDVRVLGVLSTKRPCPANRHNCAGLLAALAEKFGDFPVWFLRN